MRWRLCADVVRGTPAHTRRDHTCLRFFQLRSVAQGLSCSACRDQRDNSVSACYCLCLSGSGEGAPMNVSEPTVKRWGNTSSVVVGVIALVLFLIASVKVISYLVLRRRYRRALYVKKL